MKSRNRYRLTLLAITLLLSLWGPSFGYGRDPLTKFNPGVDMFEQGNFQGTDGMPMDGSCRGIVELILVNFERGELHRRHGQPQKGHALSQIEYQMREARKSQGQTDGHEYVRQIMSIAHHYSERRGRRVPLWNDVRLQQGNQSQGQTTVAQELFDEMKETGLPQRVFWPSEPEGHVVLVYDAERKNGKITFRVGDPNHPRDSKRIMVYDTKSKTWQASLGEKRRLEPVVPALLADPTLPPNRRRFPNEKERTFYRRLIMRAHRGLGIRQIGAAGGVDYDDVPPAHNEPRPSNTTNKNKKARANKATSTNSQLPKSPGGIALSPNLQMPGDIGEPAEIVLRDDRVVLVTSDGEFPIPEIDPRTLATVLRTLAVGEIPYVSIGTEPCDRPGFAKVTYSPSLHGTQEGLILYLADIQFKGIVAHFPFGVGRKLNTKLDQLVSGYPGAGGNSTRLWITSSEMVLKRDERRLMTAYHGMRVLGETTLTALGGPVSDPELDRYMQKLTENWEQISEQAPVFREVQEIAQATALAFWIRGHQLQVDPSLTALPSRQADTPFYSPLIVYNGIRDGIPVSGVVGGVALTPEEKSSTAGRYVLFGLATLIDKMQQQRGIAQTTLLGILVVVCGSLTVVLLPACLCWLIARITLRGTGRIPLVSLFSIWTQSLLIHWIFCVATIALLTYAPAVTVFDKNFLGLMATFAAYPVIFFVMIASKTSLGCFTAELRRRTFTRCAFGLVAITGPLYTACLGYLAGFGTILILGAVPTPAMEQLLTYQTAPSSLINHIVVDVYAFQKTQEGPKADLLPLPLSLFASMQGPFVTPQAVQIEGADLAMSASSDSKMPIDRLQRIDWMDVHPEDVAGVRHYSHDGLPPF